MSIDYPKPPSRCSWCQTSEKRMGLTRYERLFRLDLMDADPRPWYEKVAIKLYDWQTNYSPVWRVGHWWHRQRHTR